MAPSAVFQLSVDNGTSWLPADTSVAGPNGLPFGAGSTALKARLVSQADVATVEWSSTARTATTSPLVVTTNVDRSASFTVLNGTPGGWLLRAKVNGGIDPKTGEADPSLTRSLAIKVLTAGGIELLVPGEEDEADRAEGWVRAYNANAQLGPGGGGALPAPWTAAVDGGLHLSITAANTTGLGRTAWLSAQPSSTTAGGSLYLSAGGGPSPGFAGAVFLGYKSPGGLFVATLRSEPSVLTALRTNGWPLFEASIPVDAIELRTWSFSADETQTHVVEYDATYDDTKDDGNLAGFVWKEVFSDQEREVMRGNSRDGLRLVRRTTIISASGNSRIVESVYEVDTSTTSDVYVDEVALGTSENVSITVLATADNGTTMGEAVRKALFRRAVADNSGNLTQQGGGSIGEASLDEFKLGHDVTLTTDGIGSVYINVKAASSAATKWTVAVSAVFRAGVV